VIGIEQEVGKSCFAPQAVVEQVRDERAVGRVTLSQVTFSCQKGYQLRPGPEIDTVPGGVFGEFINNGDRYQEIPKRPLVKHNGPGTRQTNTSCIFQGNREKRGLPAKAYLSCCTRSREERLLRHG
jgi:hypothetical protein